MAILEVNGLKKKFGNTEVLKGVDLALEKGEVLSLIGSSGGGKTTLLRCMNFLEIADAGTIQIGGQEVFSAKIGEKPILQKNAQSHCGLVFQQFNLFPQYSVLDNLMLAPKLAAKREKRDNLKQIYDEIRKKALSLLDTVGLSEKKAAYPCELSGGQQQRVAIARALMLDPEILCFDEPTSALDPELTNEVLKVIRDLRNDGRTMIIVTHELEFARKISDKVIFMANGRIEESGPAEAVFGSPKSPILQKFLASSEQ